MDDIVKAAMAKWPNVPAVYGWLELTARGEWRIKGAPIDNASIRDFIGRNYANDGHGNWFFQNGPQRVFVSLEATPLIYRLDESGRLQVHTGAHPGELRGAFADTEGRLLLETELGPGLVDSQDTGRFAERLVDGQDHALDERSLERWTAGDGAAFLQPDGLQVRHDGRVIPVERVGSDDWPDIFGFVAQPGGGKVS
ncbi:MAG TPA: DUF2946 family protein [Burkholderiaceae bacterium]|nr:DUF2946 family protein [Burkholderiaceae bacterium]